MIYWTMFVSEVSPAATRMLLSVTLLKQKSLVQEVKLNCRVTQVKSKIKYQLEVLTVSNATGCVVNIV